MTTYVLLYFEHKNDVTIIVKLLYKAAIGLCLFITKVDQITIQTINRETWGKTLKSKYYSYNLIILKVDMECFLILLRWLFTGENLNSKFSETYI